MAYGVFPMVECNVLVVVPESDGYNKEALEKVVGRTSLC